uniref:Vesicle transport through interaction with t-SNAREs 1A n=1 Tax=Cyprinus carpio carpio TaxID=630221 RepID=A0A8C0YHS8_CYPCA
MSSDFETYELDFGTLTADITNKIGRIPKLAGEEKTQLVLNVDKQLEEVRELLEQMDLEVREIPIQSRGMYSSRLKSYKQEMEKLEKDFKERVRWREKDRCGEVKKDKKFFFFCAGFSEPYVGSHRLMGDWSLARQVSCASEIPPPFPLISPFLWC